MYAVACGWLQKGDFVIVDNAILHSGGSANVLADFLWNAVGFDGQPMNIFVVPFPTRAPELNPIELNWNTFVERMKMIRSEIVAANGGPEILMRAAGNTMNNFTHLDNLKNYIKCGYYGNK